MALERFKEYPSSFLVLASTSYTIGTPTSSHCQSASQPQVEVADFARLLSGLLIDGKVDMAKGIAEHFCFEISQCCAV